MARAASEPRLGFWRRFWQRDGEPALAACTALDVGTEFAKALVFEIDDAGHGTVRGVGRKRQGLSHMQSGTVADIAAVVDNCSVALQEAEEMAGFRPRDVVIGIAGELVKGFTTTHSQERKKPDIPITEAELQRLIDGVQREALREAERAITWETGLPHVDVRLVHAAVTGASIDGYALTNPVGFQGRHVRIGIFNAFAPLVHLGALESVASQLDLDLVEVVAEPYAVARVLGSEQVRQAGALFVDVGGGTTDVALVRQGGIEGTRMFALGGRAFTKSLADRLDLPFPRAESLKVDYARGLPVDDRDTIAGIVADDVAVWAAGVELVMEELAAGDLLPGRVHICGGGSRLPEIPAALADEGFWKRLPFARPPEVTVMSPDQVETIDDATNLLVDQQDVTPLGLAYQAIELQTTEAPLDVALRRVLRAMKV
ncbi:MAG TPA: cell division FtsA domain-containing protein [Candidatus Limnocylindrales bacterium]|nr:cell division FtsA domain-containing protein [Candidatus Limnocylindrales bacterium]